MTCPGSYSRVYVATQPGCPHHEVSGEANIGPCTCHRHSETSVGCPACHATFTVRGPVPGACVAIPDHAIPEGWAA